MRWRRLRLWQFGCLRLIVPSTDWEKGDWNPDSRIAREGNRPRRMKVGRKA